MIVCCIETLLHILTNIFKKKTKSEWPKKTRENTIYTAGIQSNTTEPIDCCMYYDGFTKAWIPLPDMPYRLIRHRSNVIEQKGRDYRWLIAGGLSKCFFVCILVCIDYITPTTDN